MPNWERYQGDDTLLALGAHATREVFFNTQADEQFEASDVVIVDGIVTFMTDTDDLCGARLLIAPTEIAIGTFTENLPPPNNQMVYYSWFFGRGPVVFRLRSKRTIPPEHKLYVQQWKASGTTSTVSRYGMHLLLVVKH